MARPSKLTAEVSEKIVRAIRAGNYPEVAAGHAGIHPATYTAGWSAAREALCPEPIVARVVQVTFSVPESSGDISEGLFGLVELDHMATKDVAERTQLAKLHEDGPIRVDAEGHPGFE